jgi:Pyruvate/2-oxoacid:ferredoxin oxidoreductase delta subunit
MEGQGPGMGGFPRELGVLLAGTDPFALDRVACRMVGVDHEALPILKAAAKMGFPASEAEIDGELPAIGDFRLPRMTSLVYGPKFLQGFIRRHVLQRPVLNVESCRICGECWTFCPAGAITRKEKLPFFDYDRCIRCYCCLEVCPHGALDTADTLAGKVFRKAASFILPTGKTK